MVDEISYGAWTTHVIRESDYWDLPIVDASWLPNEYLDNQTGPYIGQGSNRYYISQSFTQYQADNQPKDDLGARLCALAHTKERDPFTSFLGWDPGQCPIITQGTVSTGFAGQPFGDPNEILYTGTETVWQGPPLFLLPATYQLFLYNASFGLGYVPFWMESPPPFNVPPPEGEYTNFKVYRQIPGWLEAMGVGKTPQVQVLQVDGEASFGLEPAQTLSVNALSVSAHLTPTGQRGAPYSMFGPAQMTAGWGGHSNTLHFNDMQVGDNYYWNLATDRVLASADPGAFENNIATVQIQVDFVWTIRVRFQVPDVQDVCRWLNRDDGLGITGASRARTGTSLQRGMRHRGYR